MPGRRRRETWSISPRARRTPAPAAPSSRAPLPTARTRRAAAPGVLARATVARGRPAGATSSRVAARTPATSLREDDAAVAHPVLGDLVAHRAAPVLHHAEEPPQAIAHSLAAHDHD